VSKAARELQWAPQASFEEGMKALAAWFEEITR
jgi:nucleoside-diphosphate-sugar epimerase